MKNKGIGKYHPLLVVAVIFSLVFAISFLVYKFTIGKEDGSKIISLSEETMCMEKINEIMKDEFKPVSYTTKETQTDFSLTWTSNYSLFDCIINFDNSHNWEGILITALLPDSYHSVSDIAFLKKEFINDATWKDCNSSEICKFKDTISFFLNNRENPVTETLKSGYVIDISSDFMLCYALNNYTISMKTFEIKNCVFV